MADVTVQGEVSRINAKGNGFGLRETVTFGDKTRTTYWSVFPPRNVDRFVNVGDLVTVTGGLGAKVSERDARYVDFTINNAQVTGQEPWDTSEPGQGWGDDTPF